MVGITEVLGNHVGCGTTRALQHHAQFDPAVRGKKRDDSRKGGRSLGRRKTSADSAGRKTQSAQRGKMFDPFFTTVQVDDYLLIKVQHSDDDKTALIGSASLASDHVRLFGPGEEGVTPILAPKKSRDWDTTIDALGFTINSHTMTISFPRQKADAIK